PCHGASLRRNGDTSPCQYRLAGRPLLTPRDHAIDVTHSARRARRPTSGKCANDRTFCAAPAAGFTVEPELYTPGLWLCSVDNHPKPRDPGGRFATHALAGALSLRVGVSRPIRILRRLLKREPLPVDAVLGAAAEPGLTARGVIDHHVDRRATDADTAARILEEVLDRAQLDLSRCAGQQIIHLDAARVQGHLGPFGSPGHLPRAEADARQPPFR